MVANRMLYTLPIHVVETLVNISADALVDTAVGRTDAVDVVVGIRTLSSLLHRKKEERNTIISVASSKQQR